MMETPNCKTAIAWSNVLCQVNTFTRSWQWRRKTILSGVSGQFEVGTLNCIVGASGTGKTTLLNCLSGTQRLGDSSSIYYCGVLYYIQQHVQETILNKLTVEQILWYAFRFKNGGKEDESRMKKHIASTMDALMLSTDLLNRRFDRCSGGEQKRVAIAQELMALVKPTVLIIDEATTGLDSVVAFELIHCLRQLAHNHQMTVLTTIHAPNNETLALFDQLYVLAKGGFCIYSGPPRSIRDFLQNTLHIEVAHHQPPIEALIKVAGSTSIALLQKLPSQPAVPSQHRTNQPRTVRKPFTLRDLYLQLHRSFHYFFITNLSVFLLSNVFLIASYLFATTFFDKQAAVPSGCISLAQTGDNASCLLDLEQDILLKENAVFIKLTYMFVGFFTMCSGVVYTATASVKVLQSEHRNYWYSLSAYYLAQSVVNLLEVTIYAVVASLSLYFFSHQHAADSYTINYHRLSLFTFIMWTYCLYNHAIGQLIGTAMAHRLDFALVLALITHSETFMFNMSFINIEQSHLAVLVTASDLLAMKYITKAILHAFYGIDRCDGETEVGHFHLTLNIDADRMVWYLAQVWRNILLVKLFTYGFIVFKFSLCLNANRFQPILKLLQYFEIMASVEADQNYLSIDLHGKEPIKVSDNSRIQMLQSKVCIAWRNLSLLRRNNLTVFANAKQATADNTILHQLNGQLQFGTLLALMGMSGAGKTSLLKALNGRCNDRLSSETRIYLSTCVPFRSCFIVQEVSNHLISGLTALEMVVFASKLKNAGKGYVNHQRVAHKWLAELDLIDTANTKVEHCSGGERKRLAVALELTDTEMSSLVCIDEPTSGLDSNSAATVIATLRRLAHSHPIAIVTTIHQPTTEVLQQFDQLYVIARGGVCIFAGRPQHIEAHLCSAICLKRDTIPIEELIKQSCADQNNSLVVQQLSSQTNSQFTAIPPQMLPSAIPPNRTRLSATSTITLLHRQLYCIWGYQWRQLLLFYAIYSLFDISLRFIFNRHIVDSPGCLNIDADFNDTCIRTADKLKEMQHLMDNYVYTYFFGVFFLLVVLLQAALFSAAEMAVFRNEQRNGWYATSAYYLAKNAFEIIQLLPLVLLHVAIGNLCEDLRPGIYWHFVAVLLLAGAAIQANGHICGILAQHNKRLLIVLVIGTVVVFIFLSNFYIPIDRQNVLYRLLSNCSIFRLTFECFILLQYGFDRCPADAIQPILYSMKLLDDALYVDNLLMLLLNVVLLRCVAMYLLLRSVRRR